MGGRSAYTLATAIFVGAAGLLGYFGYLYIIIPKAAIFPILIFIGLEITAQSFQATPRRHYAAVALACVPAMAKLVVIFTSNVLAQLGKSIEDLDPPLAEQLQTMQMLAGGFIVTSLLVGSAMAATDRPASEDGQCLFCRRRLVSVSSALFTLRLPANAWWSRGTCRLSCPNWPTARHRSSWRLAYMTVALMLFVWGHFVKPGKSRYDDAETSA